MPVQRIFLDWDKPFLQSAAKYLSERFDGDLSEVVVILPGRRAGRKLLEQCESQAKTSKQAFSPPQLVSVGDLPELFYQTEEPLAPPLVRTLAWAQALEKLKPELRDRLANKDLFRRGSLALVSFAQALDAVWAELSAARLTFSSVITRAESGALYLPDLERWQVFAETHRHYLELISKRGYIDKFVAREQSLASLATNNRRTIVLAATADLTEVTKSFLRSAKGSAKENLISLIHAPESAANKFDDCGCIVPAIWAAEPIAVTDSKLVVANNPALAGAEVANFALSNAQKASLRDVTIGVTNEELAANITRQLSRRGMRARSSEGKSLKDSPPGKLLSAVAHYLQTKSFRDWATILRHPAIESQVQSHLRDAHGLLAELDTFFSEHLFAEIISEEYATQHENTTVAGICKHMQLLLAGFQVGPKSLTTWIEEIKKFLAAAYNENVVSDALSLLNDALDRWKATPQWLDFQCEAAEAIALFFQLEGVRVPEPQREAFELLGWLELQLDTAENLVICGLNEGDVPESVTSDPVLPNSLRMQLGLVDNIRRYARDAYAFQAILASRKNVQLIACRSTRNGESLLPSRLLLADRPEVIAKRLLAFFKEHHDDVQKLSTSEAAREKAFVYIPPKPLHLPKRIESVSITGFRDYLYCPYRFYLRHVLGLTVVNDEDDEMTASVFGTFAHEVLQQFSASAAIKSADEKVVRNSLYALVDSLSVQQFPSPLPAVRLQLEQFKTRLSAFARWQAQWCAEGWITQETEKSFKRKDFSFELDNGESIGIHGRIDRIDHNPRTNTWAIIDYKTGARSSEPGKNHYSKTDGWKDVQLPLYHAVARKLGLIGENCQLGYVILSQDVTKIGGVWASWDAAQLDAAVDVAREVCKKITRQEFWPPRTQRLFGDEFSDICGVGLLSHGDAEDAEEELR